MRRQRLGQTIVEFALLLPFLIMILLGIMEMGWYLYNNSAIDQAARRGSEQAAKEPPLRANTGKASDPCVVEIRRQAQRNLGPIKLADPASAITISYPNSGEDRDLGSEIQVQVRYQGQYLTPLASMFGGSTFTITSMSRRSILDTMVTQGTNARCP